MTQINIFRICSDKINSFEGFLDGGHGYVLKGEVHHGGFLFKLYFCVQSEPQEISWRWVFNNFNIKSEQICGLPKAVLVIRSDSGGSEYAISFGSGHFTVDPYSDHDFAFEYASKIKIHRTRLTATTNTTSRRNKTISAYKDYPYLEINSGESYVKLKIEIDDPLAKDIIDKTVEIGSSIKFAVKDVSFDGLIALVKYIEKVLAGQKITRIPVFKLVRKPEEICALETSLKAQFNQDSAFVTLSEFDVVGTNEVFNRADEFEFLYGRIRSCTGTLDRSALMQFFAQNKITSVDEMLNVRVGFCFSGVRKFTKPIHSLVDFMDEKRNALLIAGKWYMFNEDFLEYLQQSLDELEVIYNKRYDIGPDTFDKFVAKRFAAEHANAEYAGKEDAEILHSLKRKYYPERAFNLMREEEGYVVKDRGIAEIGGMKYELADLQKDDSIFTVKRGSGSSVLSYAVTQSESAVDLFVNHQTDEPRPKKMVLWLIFERKTAYTMNNGKLNWNEVGMLLLKIKIDAWKKKVRLANMEPEIWINYEGLSK